MNGVGIPWQKVNIVLPCTTPLEKDLGLTPRDPYIIKMSKLTEPYKIAEMILISFQV